MKKLNTYIHSAIRNMKGIGLTLLLAICLAPMAMAQGKVSGDEAYANGNYAEAIKIYEAAVEAQPSPSAELLYNLGCAYFKNEDNAKAILNFERAYRVNPSDRDIRYNLELANAKTVDKMEESQVFFITRWGNSVSHWFRVTTWLSMGIFLFVLFLVGTLLYLLHSERQYRVAGFYTALCAFFLCLFCNIMAYRSHVLSNDDSKAILMTEVITVKSSPDSSAQDIVVVHAGMKVSITQTLNGFAEIILPDGTVGWVQESDLELINHNL